MNQFNTDVNKYFNQLAVIDEYTRYGEMAIFCVMTSILVVRKK